MDKRKLQQQLWYKKNIERLRQYRKDYYIKNKEVLKTRGLKRYKEKRNEILFQHREYLLKTKYSITVSDYENKLEDQDFKCAICKKPRSEHGRHFHMDHDHLTGNVRGLLCNGCNLVLGKIHDSTELLKQFISYLRKHGKP